MQEPERAKLQIVTTVFPAYDFARAVAGDLADVTLLLPPGWYRPGRFLELFTDKAWQIQLAHVVDDGPDFELVGFTLRGPAP